MNFRCVALFIVLFFGQLQIRSNPPCFLQHFYFPPYVPPRKDVFLVVYFVCSAGGVATFHITSKQPLQVDTRTASNKIIITNINQVRTPLSLYHFILKINPPKNNLHFDTIPSPILPIASTHHSLNCWHQNGTIR